MFEFEVLKALEHQHKMLHLILQAVTKDQTDPALLAALEESKQHHAALKAALESQPKGETHGGS